ncbi:MAG: hypothetical protein HOO96_00835 [Polyangiaceae bacterium]|nr:hypothetical protein [Polyangiaceae bacterium]
MRRFVVVAAALVVFGCGGVDSAEDDASDEDLISSPGAAGIKPGTIEETSVLNLVNDRSLDASGYRSRVLLSSAVANGIVRFRDGALPSPDDDRVFTRIAEVDAVPSTGKAAFAALLKYAKSGGYDFAPPNLAILSVPDNLGRPPTTDDVTVVRGFDGRSPADAEMVVRKNLGNTIHPQNERFVSDTLQRAHKAFTIGVGNFFAAGSPPQRFLQAQTAGATFTLLGTASAIHTTVLRVQDPYVGALYFKRTASGYESIDASYLAADGTLRYPVIMSCAIRLNPQGVRIEYPKWSAKLLEQQTTVVVEGGG